MSKSMYDDDLDETVTVAPEKVHPFLLVAPGSDGEFVELDEGVFVRAAAVVRVLEMKPYLADPGKTYPCNVVTSDTGERGSNWSVYPARTVLAALTLALENGRKRTVERFPD
jgi:hypothetical protein